MSLRFPLCALVVLALCACGRPAARLEQARDLAISGHYQTALIEARALLLTLREARSGSADTVRRGALKLAGDLCALHLDDPRCAAHEYRELVKRYPTAPESFEARERLGDLDMRTGDVRGAAEAWADQVAAAPDSPGGDAAQLKIARALLDKGDLHEARFAAAELQSRWPDSPLAPAAALLSASTFHLAGRHAEAIEAYKKVEAKYHGTQKAADALLEQGNCLVEQGEDALAIQAFPAARVRHASPGAGRVAPERAQP